MSDPVDSDRNREHDLEPEWDPSVHRLPVWATIREAVQAIAKEWKALLKGIAVPALVLAAVNVFFQRNPEYVEAVFPDLASYLQALLQIVAESALSVGFAMMIAISCHRLVILGVDSLPSAWGLFWSRRETRFLGWSMLISLITLLPFAVLGILVGILVAVLGPSFTVSAALPFILLVLPFVWYAIARLSLVLPATAIGQRPTLKGSWRLSRSNGWRLALVMFLPSLVLIPLSVGSFQLGGIAPQFLAAFPLVLLGLIEISALSKAFCWFTGEIEAKSPS